MYLRALVSDITSRLYFLFFKRPISYPWLAFLLTRSCLSEEKDNFPLPHPTTHPLTLSTLTVAEASPGKHQKREWKRKQERRWRVCIKEKSGKYARRKQ
jgi:hypothetical protein